MADRIVDEGEIERLLTGRGLAARILDRSFDAVVVSDLDGRVLWANEVVCSLVGTARDGLVGQVRDDFCLGLGSETKEALTEALRGDGRFGPRVVRLTGDGPVRVMELFAEIAEVDGRQASIVIGRAMAPQGTDPALREIRIDFQDLVEQLPGAVYLELHADAAEKRTAYASPRYQEMFGLEVRSDVPSVDNWRHIIHPEDLDRVIAESERTDLTEEPYVCEYRVTPEDRPTMWVHDEAVLVRQSDGAPSYWLGLMTDISDRVRAEEELRLAEQKLRTLVEQIPVAVYTQAPTDPTNFYISPQIAEITGYSIDDFCKVGFWQACLHPDDRDAVMAEAIRTDETEEPFDMEYRMTGPDGRIIWIHEVSVPVRTDPDQTTVLWQGIFEDVTARRVAESQLREAEDRYRTLIEHIPVAAYTQTHGSESDYFISPQIEQITGWPVSFFEKAEGWSAMVHPEDRPWVVAEAERTDMTREPFDLEYRVVKPDGAVMWIRDVAALIEGTDGAPDLWQGVVEDVTERRRSEMQLREAEERYRALVEHVPAVTYQERVGRGSYPESTIMYVSPQIENILGHSWEELELDSRAFWDRLIYKEDLESVIESSATAVREGGAYEQEYRIVRGDGSIGWVRDEAVRVSTEPDGTQYWHGFLTDITKRKDAEAELEHALRMEREAVERLRSLDELKTTFLNAVSHDLRTPLAAILGLALTLERDDLELERSEGRDLTRRIASNARKLERLVTDLLDLDRLSRGILEPQLVTTNLGLLVRKVVTEFDVGEYRPIIVEAEEVSIPVDAAKVERIVENLVANSVRHTPDGTRVWVRVTPEDGGALIAIEDEGPGVNKAMREAIFEPFRQAESPHSHSPGVGIGLSLVARFVELHAGRVWVQDREGGGASFRVFLPGLPAADEVGDRAQAR